MPETHWSTTPNNRANQGGAPVVEQREGGWHHGVGVRVSGGHVGDQQRRLQALLDRPLRHARLVGGAAHHGGHAPQVPVAGDRGHRASLERGQHLRVHQMQRGRED